MAMKPMPIRFTEEQDARLAALAASGDFTKQELVRLAVTKLFERLDKGEAFVVQKVLRTQREAENRKPQNAEKSGKKRPRRTVE
jgi:hypothetical protein